MNDTTELNTSLADLESVVEKMSKLFEMTTVARGEWQRDFFKTMVDANIGIDLDTARAVLGLACDYMSPVYIQGHGRGYEQGHADGLKRANNYELGYKLGLRDGSEQAANIITGRGL